MQHLQPYAVECSGGWNNVGLDFALGLAEPSSFHTNEESAYFDFPDSFRRPTYSTDALVLKADSRHRTDSNMRPNSRHSDMCKF